ncbi:MAG: phosphoenolpyruvate carboxykinase (ATP), partial [Candidatus Omnitrophica bacterium]|nr:phosphoenolpyruvate carboxykinase (ATP) [Candidatus Omnitrophota bacterium]
MTGIRFTSLLVAILFAWETVAWSAPPVATSESRPALPLINIPQSLGSIQEKFVPDIVDPETPFVIHIQDIHSHPEAQRHVASILEHLAHERKIGRISVEGAFAEIDPKILNLFPVAKANQAMVDFLASEGELTGSELFAFEQHRPAVQVMGADHPRLYGKSFKAFQEVKKKKTEVRAFFNFCTRRLEELEADFLNPGLRDFSMKRRAWESEKQDLFEYLTLLGALSKQALKLDLADPRNQFEWPQLLHLVKIAGNEARVKPESVRREVQSLVSELRRRLPRGPARESLIQGLVKLLDPATLTLGRPARHFFESLHREAKAHDFSLLNYPNLLTYGGLVILREEIDSSALFREMESLEEKLELGLAKNSRERELIRLGRDISLLEKLLTLRMSRSDFDRYLEKGPSLAAPVLKKRFERISKIDFLPPALPESVQETAERFYRLSRQRDEILLENALKQSSSKHRSTVLVSGGFHTEGMLEALRAKKIPYVVITPRITGLEDDSAYERAMMGENSRLDRFLSTKNALVKVLLAQSPESYAGPVAVSRLEQRDLLLSAVPIGVKVLKAEGWSDARILSALEKSFARREDIFSGVVPIFTEGEFHVAFSKPSNPQAGKFSVWGARPEVRMEAEVFVAIGTALIGIGAVGVTVVTLWKAHSPVSWVLFWNRKKTEIYAAIQSALSQLNRLLFRAESASPEDSQNLAKAPAKLQRSRAEVRANELDSLGVREEVLDKIKNRPGTVADLAKAINQNELGEVLTEAEIQHTARLVAEKYPGEITNFQALGIGPALIKAFPPDLKTFRDLLKDLNLGKQGRVRRILLPFAFDGLVNTVSEFSLARLQPLLSALLGEMHDEIVRLQNEPGVPSGDELSKVQKLQIQRNILRARLTDLNLEIGRLARIAELRKDPLRSEARLSAPLTKSSEGKEAILKLQGVKRVKEFRVKALFWLAVKGEKKRAGQFEEEILSDTTLKKMEGLEKKKTGKRPNLRQAKVGQFRQALAHGFKTAYGSTLYYSNKTNRSAKRTEHLEMDGFKADFGQQKANYKFAQKVLAAVEDFLEGKELIQVDRSVGQNPDESRHFRFLVSKDYGRLAHELTSLHFPARPSASAETPDILTIDLPDFDLSRYGLAKQKQPYILRIPSRGITLVLGTDYFGEVKKSVLTMNGYLAKLKGDLALHAGSKVVRDRDVKTGRRKTIRIIASGLSGTGKTTTLVGTQGLGRRSKMKQDDFVELRFKKHKVKVKGLERGTYYKTAGLDPKKEPELFNAAKHPDTILSNVWMNENPQGGLVPDYGNVRITANGRGVVTRERITQDPSVDMNGIDLMIWLTRRRTIVPALSLLTPAQAAAFWVLGESELTSAADPTKAGESANEPGFSSFIAGSVAEEANRLYEFLRANPGIQVVLANTGRVGAKPGSEGVKIDVLDSAALFRALYKGNIKWANPDPDWGYRVVARAPGFNSSRFNPRHYYSSDEYQQMTLALRANRLAWLKNFTGLHPDIVAAIERSEARSASRAEVRSAGEWAVNRRSEARSETAWPSQQDFIFQDRRFTLVTRESAQGTRTEFKIYDDEENVVGYAKLVKGGIGRTVDFETVMVNEAFKGKGLEAVLYFLYYRYLGLKHLEAGSQGPAAPYSVHGVPLNFSFVEKGTKTVPPEPEPTPQPIEPLIKEAKALMDEKILKNRKRPERYEEALLLLKQAQDLILAKEGSTYSYVQERIAVDGLFRTAVIAVNHELFTLGTVLRNAFQKNGPTPLRLEINAAGDYQEGMVEKLKRKSLGHFLAKVIAQPEGEKRKKLLEAFKSALDIPQNRRRFLEFYGEPLIDEFKEVISLNRPDPEFTSYPYGEVRLAAGYLMTYRGEEFIQEVERLRESSGTLSPEITSEELFSRFDEGVNRLVGDLKLPETLAYQVRAELQLQFYNALLKGGMAEKRDVRIALTTPRDGDQSDNTTALTGQDRRRLMEGHIGLGIRLHDIETYGGNTNMAYLLESLHHKELEDPWYNLQQQTALLERKLRELVLPNGENVYGISTRDQQKLFSRYRFRQDRKILSEEELRKILNKDKYPLIAAGTKLGDEIIRRYLIRQEMLLRGQYVVALKPMPDSVLELFIKMAGQGGVDILRIFDAFNDNRKIIKAIRYARETGAKAQPVIHFTPKFPKGVAGYVELAKELIRESGEALDALVIKDAPGRMRPVEAFRLVKALRDSDIKAPLLTHTHDSYGDRQLTLLEAIRANGPDYPIIMDLGVGKGALSSPFGQPDVVDFIRLTDGTPWQVPHADDTLERLRALERWIADSLMPEYKNRIPTSPTTTWDRQAYVEAGLPGGMKSSFIDVDIKEGLQGLETNLFRAKFGIRAFEDHKDSKGKFTTLTPLGERLKHAFIVQVLQEMIRVEADAGEISMVTPTSQWTGVQAFHNVLGWLMKGYLVAEISKDKSNVVLKKSASYPEEDRMAQYAHPQAPVIVDFQNYFILWAQDPYLQDLYPGVNRKLVAKAFGLLSYPGAPIDLERVQRALLGGKVNTKEIRKALAAFKDVKGKAGKEFVDSDVILLTRSLRTKYPKVKSDQLPREAILKVAKELKLNIPLTVKELRASYKGRGDRDLLLLALFPTRAEELFEKRKFWQGEWEASETRDGQLRNAGILERTGPISDRRAEVRGEGGGVEVSPNEIRLLSVSKNQRIVVIAE